MVNFTFALDGQYKAIVLSFSLDSACYATMVLREILKCNTSTSSQAGLNNYGAKKPTTNRVIINIDSDTKQWKDVVEVRDVSKKLTFFNLVSL